ncbi:MAG: hypothetical protein A3H06_00405 [Candidatus Colwellbacteria bacterium RIFCSPLOWO2_12_FULL_44_13]|uniref:Recombination protein RecR n=3 Tax=Candidatus Colwelliibacteriota TaxID=1817904 RepID=A0A1G1Z5B6_9BACT|nr:MAG: hypothetical protein A3F24_02015 [Candidatus Colwellbacteria bacterium RIFCSPHIGHO2_12_FULL_44_17]OGY59828.1 MAG: hypothetical protein A3I31_01630 [Candidatus Colwellbacteria bacterium RIFCSPLOWO2_02_FULL_44_20b]OGY61553.1 MAG: hypothetical protein A3H06_00405 [Candidatus Colwellbacteria bacterium RIFCSPLOWO2_12_FULL_44_13]
MTIPEPIKKFVDIFSELPGVGPRQAIRLAFHFITSGANTIEEARSALGILGTLKPCKNCFFITNNKTGLCDICSDERRDKRTIAIVEKETDLLSLEHTKRFRGRYLVLGDLKKNGLLDPSQKLRLKSLRDWIKKELGGTADEIVIAVNPTTYGDLNASVIRGELQDFAKKISSLGRGIPTGGEIEFADEETLGEALTRRN